MSQTLPLLLNEPPKLTLHPILTLPTYSLHQLLTLTLNLTPKYTTPPKSLGPQPDLVQNNCDHYIIIYLSINFIMFSFLFRGSEIEVMPTLPKSRNKYIVYTYRSFTHCSYLYFFLYASLSFSWTEMFPHIYDKGIALLVSWVQCHPCLAPYLPHLPCQYTNHHLGMAICPAG